MRRTQPATRRSAARRTLPVVLAIAVVALAGLGADRRAPRRVSDRGDGVLVANLTMAFAVVVVAATMVLLGFALFNRGSDPERASSGARSGARMVALIVAVFAVVLVILRRLRPSDPPAERVAEVATSKPATLPPPSSTRATWGLGLGLAIVAACVVALVVVAILARRRRPDADRLVHDLHADAAAAVGDVVRDVEAEPDPRLAVIRAYDGMERVFAPFEIRRASSETPAEFLARAVAETGLSADSMRSLTSLYVAARFDVREIDEGMRRAAIDALRAVRDELGDLAVTVAGEGVRGVVGVAGVPLGSGR